MDMGEIKFLTTEELLAGVEHIKATPKDEGELKLIVIRPGENQRVELEACELSPELGVHGDSWAKERLYGPPHPDIQVTLMNSRVIELIAQDLSRWSLAGDNLYVDLDLSAENLQMGQKLAVGTVELEITSEPHTGCGKFMERYGKDAVKFVNSPLGKQHHFRGIYAKITKAGHVRVGDRIRKI